MTLNDFFDKVFCINLERRKDRKIQMEVEFTKHGIEAEFVKAVDARLMSVPIRVSEDGTVIQKGYFGCLLSHLHVVKEAKRRGYKNYLVLEDDADMDENFQKLFSEFIKRVPKDWDMLYFGGNHMEKPKMIADNVATISKTYTTHAYSVSDKMYDVLIEALDKIEKLDISLSKLHKKHHCYVFQPHLIMQRESHSDILERNNGDWTLEKRPT